MEITERAQENNGINSDKSKRRTTTTDVKIHIVYIDKRLRDGHKHKRAAHEIDIHALLKLTHCDASCHVCVSLCWCVCAYNNKFRRINRIKIYSLSMLFVLWCCCCCCFLGFAFFFSVEQKLLHIHAYAQLLSTFISTYHYYYYMLMLILLFCLLNCFFVCVGRLRHMHTQTHTQTLSRIQIILFNSNFTPLSNNVYCHRDWLIFSMHVRFLWSLRYRNCCWYFIARLLHSCCWSTIVQWVVSAYVLSLIIAPIG